MMAVAIMIVAWLLGDAKSMDAQRDFDPDVIERSFQAGQERLRESDRRMKAELAYQQRIADAQTREMLVRLDAHAARWHH